MTAEEKWSIKSAFYDFVIKDPYPEISEYQMKCHALMDQSFIKMFGERNIKNIKKPEISAHKAWTDGFEFAKELILNRLEKIK